MLIQEMQEGLKEVLNVLNPTVNYSFEEVCNTIQSIHKDKTPEQKKLILSAYIGFSIGKEYGFGLGRDFIFDYTPENDY